MRFINHTLQGNLVDAGKSSIRFGLNTTIGLVGLFDVASYLEIYQEDTSFDATLQTWDLPAGPYVELPFLGPNSVRSSIAALIDFSLDPIGSNINSTYKFAYHSTQGIDLLNTRYEFSRYVFFQVKIFRVPSIKITFNYSLRVFFLKIRNITEYINI